MTAADNAVTRNARSAQVDRASGTSRQVPASPGGLPPGFPRSHGRMARKYFAGVRVTCFGDNVCDRQWAPRKAAPTALPPEETRLPR